MTIKEMLEKINGIREQLLEDNEWEYIGVRFENKDRELGEICERSKDNPDREDERDYPEYGTPEYDELPEREGTCAWDLEYGFKVHKMWHSKDVSFLNDQKHCYIIAGYETEYIECIHEIDEDEIIIIDAEVVAKIY